MADLGTVQTDDSADLTTGGYGLGPSINLGPVGIDPAPALAAAVTTGQIWPRGVGPQGATGPQGPQGPPGSGGSGTATLAFRYVQPTPATVWTINHGLSFYPNVAATDSSHREVYGEVDYPSATSVQLTFSAAISGEVYCS